MKTWKLIFSLLLLAGTGLPALAADNDEPQYQVELLVFRHLDQSRSTPEAPRVMARNMDSQLERQLAQIDVAGTDTTPGVPEADTAAPQPATAWEPVISGTRLLSKEAEKLRRLGAYELLGHLAWTQTAPDVADAESIALAELGLDAQEAHGTISLYSKRYLHLAVDVALGPELAATTDQPDPFSFPNAVVVSMQPEISASRRIRPGQLTYFDAPEFGVIAVAERIPAANER
ncbi:MAG: CsiV family protein [Gammaproteobacteria bacterium]|jgi:hypothetical protein|nr:CsiV family protein [Gammaproteobacteria bacterium]